MTGLFPCAMASQQPLPYQQVHTILEGIQGKGHYVGTYLAWGANNKAGGVRERLKFFLMVMGKARRILRHRRRRIVEVVLHSCAFPITIQVKFDLPFTPPAFIGGPRRKVRFRLVPVARPHLRVSCAPADRAKDYCDAIAHGIGPVCRAPPSMCNQSDKRCLHRIWTQVLDRHPRVLPKRHLPVAVEAARRIYGYRQRTHVAALTPAVAEKALGHLYRRASAHHPSSSVGLSAPVCGMDSHPT